MEPERKILTAKMQKLNSNAAKQYCAHAHMQKGRTKRVKNNKADDTHTNTHTDALVN